jgi:hypothetical protein
MPNPGSVEMAVALTLTAAVCTLIVWVAVQWDKPRRRPKRRGQR